MSDVLGDIQSLRRAARAAVRRADLSDRERCAAIVELAFRARETEWPWAAQQAVWVESRDYLAALTGEEWMSTDAQAWEYMADVTGERWTDIPGDPVERACRTLTASQYVRCPACHRALPTEDELERWHTLRAAAVEEAMRREVAVDA